jgi:hypothetical protein
LRLSAAKNVKRKLLKNIESAMMPKSPPAFSINFKFFNHSQRKNFIKSTDINKIKTADDFAEQKITNVPNIDI